MRGAIRLLVPAVLAAITCFAATPISKWLAFAVGAIDAPGPRKVHRKPIPRLGGLAVLAGIALGLIASTLLGTGGLPSGLLPGAALGILPIVIVSFWDDVRPIRPLTKLGAQSLAALIAVWYGIGLKPDVHAFGTTFHIGVLAVPISVLWIVGVTNAFNLVDGLDGLSAGLALISSGSLAAVFILSGQTALAVPALVVAGALIGFLPSNLFPATVFLGESGAATIGFALACLSLQGGARLSAGFATVLPVFALGLPVAETLISVARRVVRRMEAGSGGVMVADRNHIHHRLLDLGLEHHQAVLMLYGVGLLFAAGGLASVLMSTRHAGLLLIALMVAAFIGIARLGYDEFALIRRGSVLQVYEAPVLKRSLFVVFLDLLMMAAAVYVAVGLRTSDWGLESHAGAVLQLFALVAPVSAATYSAMGLYKGAWRLASIGDFVRATSGVLVGGVAAVAAAQLVEPAPDRLPIIVIFTLLMLVLVNGTRGSYRVLQSRQWQAAQAGRPALVYGAGLGGSSVLREILSNPEARLFPVGFLDDDPEKLSRTFGGYPVLGGIDELERLLQERPGLTVIISTSKITRERCARLVAACRANGAEVLRYQVVFEPVVGDLSVDDESDPQGVAVVRGFPRPEARARA